MDKINAYILAAGYGERLRPITDHIPKPLLPICGKPIIATVLDKISALSPEIICINTHYKAEQLQNWLNNRVTTCNISFFYEPLILGTGGALKNAESMLRSSAFIVHNADILSEVNLEALISRHFDSNNIATLAVHNHDEFNNVLIDNNGVLKSVGNVRDKEKSDLCKIAFMGIAVYSPEIFNYIPDGNSSVVDAWLKSTAAGQSIGTVDFSGAAWTDIGNPEAYAAAVFDALKKHGETIYVHSSVDCSKAELNGPVIIEEGVTINTPCCLCNSILLPGTTLADTASIKNTIVGPGFFMPLTSELNREIIPLTPLVAEWFNISAGSASAINIGAGGSDRTYHRLSLNDKTAILMKCTKADKDYMRHVTFTRFFRKYSIPVPDIFVIDEENRQALFEDLGDLSLYSWLKCRRSINEIEKIYRKVLDIIIRLQTVAANRLSECPMLREKVFDYNHLRWETDYFIERFIKGILNNNRIDPALSIEFDSLAKKVDAYPKTLVHRDFQSQNIMITKDNMPRLIDYQGARLGPAAYDLVSMLWDPYYRLEDSLREQLIDYCIMQMKHASPLFSEADFRATLLPCRLQRHMQALGAYGFLAAIKGKAYFLKHTPRAVQYLRQETVLAQETYPTLHALVNSIS